MSTCVWQRYDPQDCLQRKLGLNTNKKKEKQDIINNFNQKENKDNSWIPYEKVGDQVLLEKPGILRKLSTPRTVPYPVTNVYKNGTIRNQKTRRNCIRKSEYP
jgi:hypothetical protein